MKLSATKYAELLLALVENEQVRPALVAGFLNILRKNRQERLLPRILLATEQLFKKQQGLVEVTLTVAQKSDTAEISAALQESLQAKEILLHEVLDPACLGGAYLQIGDRGYDFTLRRQLSKLQSALLS